MEEKTTIEQSPAELAEKENNDAVDRETEDSEGTVVPEEELPADAQIPDSSEERKNDDQ